MNNFNISFNPAFIKFAQRDIDSGRFGLAIHGLLVYALTDVRYARGYKIKQKRLKRRQASYRTKPQSNFDEES